MGLDMLVELARPDAFDFAIVPGCKVSRSRRHDDGSCDARRQEEAVEERALLEGSQWWPSYFQVGAIDSSTNSSQVAS